MQSEIANSFPVNISIAQNIQLLRQQRGVSLQELAERIGTTKSQIDKLEKGERRLTVEWLMKIAEGLQAEAGQLLSALTNPHLGEEESLPYYSGPSLAVPPAWTPPDNPSAAQPLPVRVRSDALRGVLYFLEIPSSFVARPPSLVGIHSAFALYMPDDRCAPRYLAGDLLYVNPERPPQTQSWVLVTQEERADVCPFQRETLLASEMELRGTICGVETAR